MQILYSTAGAVAEANMWVRAHTSATGTAPIVLQKSPLLLCTILVHQIEVLDYILFFVDDL